MAEKIWLKSYPPGVPAEINPQAYCSIVDLLAHATAQFGHRPATSNFGTQLSYNELDTLSGYFAAYLQQGLKLKKGDRFAIMLPNVLQYHVAMFGALKAGLMVVNVNPLYTAPELVHQLNDAEVSAILVLANFGATLAEAIPQIPSIQHVIVTELGDLLGCVKGKLANFIVRYIKRLVPVFDLNHTIAFTSAMRLGRQLPMQPVPLQREDIAFLQATGGTTGVPKATMLTHGNIVANVEQAYSWVMDSNLREGEEIVIAPLPLYHIFSLTVCGLCFIKMGAEIVLVTNPKDLPGLIRLLRRVRYTVMISINTLCHALLQQEGFKKLAFDQLKLVVVGGMPLQQAVADQWYEVTGKRILEGYGLTEASPIVSINPPNIQRFTGSIGLPVPSTDIAIRDGEICVKGPQVMLGYWRNEAETKLVLSEDGWLKTGDIGHMDKDGFLYLCDRKKEMILVSGFNVYPNEVENVITECPGVAEAAVIAVPSEATGEAIKAFVVRNNPSVTAQDITDFCHKNLTRYKVPKLIEFVDSLPKSNVGKILRRELREREKLRKMRGRGEGI